MKLSTMKSSPSHAMKSPAAPKAMSSWGLILFGIPFLAAGLGVLIWSLGWWKLYKDSEAWIKIPANIDSVSFESHRGSKGGSTYSVTCAYSFKHEGKTYYGSKVGMESGSSGDSFHRARYDILNRHKTEKEPFEALVNPLDPSKSVLFREITTAMYILPLFGLVFFLAGAGVMTGGVMSTIKSYSGRAMLAANPGRPWLADKRWQSPVLRDSPMPKIIGNFVMALFVGIFMSMFVIAVLKGNVPLMPKLIIFGFCLIPVGLITSGIYQIMRYVKYGTPELVLNQIPLVPGKLNTATLNIQAKVSAQEGIKVSLKLFRRVWEKSGKKNSIREYEEFSLDQNVMQDQYSSQNSIPLSFMIPDDVQQTHIGDYPEYVWRIIAVAKTPGVDFRVQFEVPVYKV
jgi:hypothetical protein